MPYNWKLKLILKVKPIFVGQPENIWQKSNLTQEQSMSCDEVIPQYLSLLRMVKLSGGDESRPTPGVCAVCKA